MTPHDGLMVVRALAIILSGALVSARALSGSVRHGSRLVAALVLPAFGPSGIAALDAVLFHHSPRIASVGLSWASLIGLALTASASVWLGIKTIDARIFRYVLFAAPVFLVCVALIADSTITRGEGMAMLASYGGFVAAIGWIERRPAASVAQRAGNPLRDAGLYLAGAGMTALGAVALIAEVQNGSAGASALLAPIMAAGAVLQIATFAAASLLSGRSDLAVAGIAGFLAFNSAAMLGALGLSLHNSRVDPDAYLLAALASLAVPAVLLPVAFRATKHAQGRAQPVSDVEMDNIFAWRNLKRDLSNYQLLRHRDVDGHLVTGMNSGTHWLAVMLAAAIAEEHGLPAPKYFSFGAAGELVGTPRALVRRPGVPAILLSHNHPASPLAWPLVRRVVPFPKQVVLVRDIREVLISAYVKWEQERGIAFCDFVRGDPANRRGYLCDVWWYISFLNRWGDIKTGRPDDTLVVRYEDLLADPALWLRRIGAHFGMSFGARALAAAFQFRDKQAALARRDPQDRERVIADLEAKAAVRFSSADMATLRSILARHLRYDYGYDYGLTGTKLVSLKPSPAQDEPALLRTATTRRGGWA